MPNPGDAEERWNAFSVSVRDSKEFTIKALRKIHPTDRCELDLHADTIIGGANCILLETSGETANVHSFSDEKKTFSNVPIGTIATALVDQRTGEVIVLVMNEALYFGNRLDHTLICPNQLRSFGIVVDNAPKQFSPKSTHSIEVPGDSLTIPLEINGFVTFFSSHKPSKDELENCRQITLSSNIPWDSNDLSCETQERVMNRQIQVSEVIRNGDRDPDVTRVDREETDFVLMPDPPELLDEDKFAERMIQLVDVAWDDWIGDGLDGYENPDLFCLTDINQHVFSLSVDDKSNVITKEILAWRWGIGLDTAHKTLKCMTQRGI
jgi:hypothetical protein